MSAFTARGFAAYCVFRHVPLSWSLRAACYGAHPFAPRIENPYIPHRQKLDQVGKPREWRKPRETAAVSTHTQSKLKKLGSSGIGN